MAVLLGALSSLLIGLADFLGRFGTRRSNAITTTNTALVGGVLISALAIPVVASRWVTKDVLLGATSGLLIGFALALLYQAMSVSSAALAGPLVALGTASIPLGWDVLFGRTPTALTGAGIAVAIVGLLMITLSPELRLTRARGVKLATLSALLFGSGFILLGETTQASGVWAPFAQRVVALGVVTVLATARSVPRLTDRKLLPIALASGVLGGAAIVALTLGLQRGSLGTVSVAGSMYPAVSATLAALYDDDVLRRWQAIGIGVVILGVSLIAIG